MISLSLKITALVVLTFGLWYSCAALINADQTVWAALLSAASAILYVSLIETTFKDMKRIFWEIKYDDEADLD